MRKAFGMVFHRHFDTTRSRIFLRPDFGQSTSTDFGQTVKGRFKFVLKNLSLPKVCEALYLRFGLTLLPFTDYFVYAQIPIAQAYEFTGDYWKEMDGFRDHLMQIVEEENLALSKRFLSMRVLPNIDNNIVTGIHLTYDRNTVEDRMWDTSLSEHSLNHPTLMACAAAFDFFLNDN